MIRRPPSSTHCISSAASDVYKRQHPSGKATPRARAGPLAADTRRLPSGKHAVHHARPSSPGAGVRQALAGGAPQFTQRRGCSAL
eukprot:4753734-Alexandrium_andersonii.AAC.1